MLRALVFVLLLVNVAFYAWTQGWLNQVVGVRPDGQHEPQRLQLQQHADQVQVIAPGQARGKATGAVGLGAASGATAAAAVGSGPVSEPEPAEAAASPAASSATSATPAAAGSPTAVVAGGATVASAAAPSAASSALLGRPKLPICVEAGPFLATEWPSAEAEVKRVLPMGHWTTQAVAVAGLWLVYMGPYPDDDMLARKQAELRRIKGLNFEEVRTPSNLAQGLSLGRYNREDEAEQALTQLRNRGVRTAKVVNVRPPMTVQILRVPAADEAQQVRLAGLKLPPGKAFVACRG